MITFNALSLPVPALDVARETAWLRRVVASHGCRLGEVNYVFCNDEEILEVNRRYLQHDYYTDIITFDYSGGDVNDKGPGEREIMEAAENAALALR